MASSMSKPRRRALILVKGRPPVSLAYFGRSWAVADLEVALLRPTLNRCRGTGGRPKWVRGSGPLYRAGKH
jgi:hypothetical protein